MSPVPTARSRRRRLATLPQWDFEPPRPQQVIKRASWRPLTGAAAAATSVVMASATSITAVTPVHQPGLANIVVTNPLSLAGTTSDLYNGALTIAILANAFTFTDVPTPPTFLVLTAVSASEIDVSWTPSGGTSDEFEYCEGINCTDFVARAGTVGGGGGTGIQKNLKKNTKYRFRARGLTACPTVKTPYTPILTATTMQTASGVPVTIMGTGFSNKDGCGVTSVTFDGVAATSLTIVSDTVLTVVPPDHACGLVTVVITDACGNTTTLYNGFRYCEQTPCPT